MTVSPIEVAIRNWLLEDSTISGLVGTRVYPLELPVGISTPAISYMLVSDPLQKAPGHYRQRIQFSVWVRGADSVMQGFPVARKVKDAIRAKVDGRGNNLYPCELAGDTYRYKIISIEFAGGPDLAEPETCMAHIPVDLIVEYWEGIEVVKPPVDPPDEKEGNEES